MRSRFSPSERTKSLGIPIGRSSDAGPDAITSRDNKWLKMFRAALRGTGPTAGELIGIEGTKLVEEALSSALEVEALLVSETGENQVERILRAAAGSETGIARSRILRTTDKLFAGVAGTEAPQGVAALLRPPDWALDDVLRGRATADGVHRADSALAVVLVGVQDPGNVGTIVRSAEAFGATGAIATRGTADPWSPKAIRASAGSALRLPLLRSMATPVVLAQLKIAGVKVYAASSHVAQPSSESGVGADLCESCAIFIGNEGAGLPSEVLHAADALIAIPMSEAVESLNAGVAASVVLYEAARQRKRASNCE